MINNFSIMFWRRLDFTLFRRFAPFALSISLITLFIADSKKIYAHTVNCNASGCNQSLWINLDGGFISWVNTQCSTIFSDTVFRNLVRCLLQKLTNNDSSAHCRCKETPNDCTISNYVAKNLVSSPISLPVPGKGEIRITALYIDTWTINNLTCGVSVIDDPGTTCGSNDYYPSYDELRISINLDITATGRIIANQTAVGGGSADVYQFQARLIGTPIEAGVAVFIRHLENFLAPSGPACTGPDLQDVGLSLIRVFIGNPAQVTIRWTSAPSQDFLRRLVAFLDVQLRYLGRLIDVPAGVRNPYLGPASVYDMSDLVGTDTIQSPSTTRSCRKGGKIAHPLGGTVWFDLGMETGWCASGGGILMRGAVDIDVDYDDVPSVGDPGTQGCSCPAVSGGGNPCGGANICAAIHCSFFQRFWCLLINERVLNIEDPPGSGRPISKNTTGTFGGIMNAVGSCEQWVMILPKIKSWCPSGSSQDRLMGIRAVPTGCGSVSCGATMQRPDSGALVSYPVDIMFSVPLDLEFWLDTDATAAVNWNRLFSFLMNLNLGVNLAWWNCATGGGSPCQAWHRVFYLGAVIDPEITGVDTDATLPGYPPGGWAQSIADLLGVLLHGNLFLGAYVGIGLRPIIDPNNILPNPPNLDPVPADTYTPGTFTEPNLASSIDASGGFLRFRWNISGQLTGQWLGRFLDENLGIAPKISFGPRMVGRTFVIHSKPTWDKLEVFAYSDSIQNPHFVWRIDGGVWRGPEPSGRLRFGPFIEGKHKIEIAALDVSTGEFSEPAVIEFTIDSVAPEIKTNVEDIMRTKFVLVVDAYDFITPKEDILISYALNDGEWSEWTKDKTFQISVPEGENMLKIRAKDKAGNISLYSKKFFAVKNSTVGCGRGM